MLRFFGEAFESIRLLIGIKDLATDDVNFLVIVLVDRLDLRWF